MPLNLGCVALAGAQRLIVCDAVGFSFLDLTTGQVTRIYSLEAHLPQNQLNDGKVDSAGRLWVGSMDKKGVEPTGSLYRLDPDLSVRRIDSGFICSNGLGWSPDNRVMYFTDSMVRTIWAYDFDIRSGELGERRIFSELPRSDGVPDGLAVDRQGFVWSAIWDGWRVIRYAPDGTIDTEVPLPVQRPSSCAFGDTNLSTLYITSACDDLTWSDLQRGPLAGALFSLQVDVPGLPLTNFGG